MFGTQPLQFQQPQLPQLPQLQQQQQPANSGQQLAENLAKMAVALTRPALYSDERNNIIAKLNQVLAFAGCGKGYFHNTSAPVEFTPENPFCRFKCVGYNRLSGNKNEDGLVSFVIKKSANEITNIQQQFVDGAFKIMGSKPNLSLVIVDIRPLPKDKDNNERCEIVAYVNEASAINDSKRKISALESYAFFNQANNKAQLGQMFVVDLAPKVDPALDKLDEYLALPHQGIDATMWRQAQRDNPDPNNLIPWPILGFDQLRARQIMQQQEVSRQSDDLQGLIEKIEKIEQKALTSHSRVAQLKASEDQLSHRVLLILGKLLRRSREGHALDADEERLHSQLESIFLRLNGPLQVKGRLSELLSQFRTRNYPAFEQSAFPKASLPDTSAVTSKFEDEIRGQFKVYQDGLEKLVEIVQRNAKDLEIMEDAFRNRDRSLSTK